MGEFRLFGGTGGVLKDGEGITTKNHPEIRGFSVFWGA